MFVTCQGGSNFNENYYSSRESSMLIMIIMLFVLNFDHLLTWNCSCFLWCMLTFCVCVQQVDHQRDVRHLPRWLQFQHCSTTLRPQRLHGRHSRGDTRHTNRRYESIFRHLPHGHRLSWAMRQSTRWPSAGNLLDSYYRTFREVRVITSCVERGVFDSAMKYQGDFITSRIGGEVPTVFCLFSQVLCTQLVTSDFGGGWYRSFDKSFWLLCGCVKSLQNTKFNTYSTPYPASSMKNWYFSFSQRNDAPGSQK